MFVDCLVDVLINLISFGFHNHEYFFHKIINISFSLEHVSSNCSLTNVFLTPFLPYFFEYPLCKVVKLLSSKFFFFNICGRFTSQDKKLFKIVGSV